MHRKSSMSVLQVMIPDIIAVTLGLADFFGIGFTTEGEPSKSSSCEARELSCWYFILTFEKEYPKCMQVARSPSGMELPGEIVLQVISPSHKLISALRFSCGISGDPPKELGFCSNSDDPRLQVPRGAIVYGTSVDVSAIAARIAEPSLMQRWY